MKVQDLAELDVVKADLVLKVVDQALLLDFAVVVSVFDSAELVEEQV